VDRSTTAAAVEVAVSFAILGLPLLVEPPTRSRLEREQQVQLGNKQPEQLERILFGMFGRQREVVVVDRKTARKPLAVTAVDQAGGRGRQAARLQTKALSLAQQPTDFLDVLDTTAARHMGLAAAVGRQIIVRLGLVVPPVTVLKGYALQHSRLTVQTKTEMELALT